MSPGARRGATAGLVVALFLTALNLRPSVAAVGPLIEAVRADLGISRAVGGLLTTLPMLCMGLLAPAAARLGRRIGIERGIVIALALIAASSALRLGAGGLPLLLVSTVGVGTGIALGQTLMPGLVKQGFPGRTALMTGVYAAGINVGAAVAARGAPVAADVTGGWRGGLAVWALPAVVALLWWMLPGVGSAARPPSVAPAEGLWRSRRAWLIAAFFAITTLTYFSVLTWLAPVYEEAGWSEERAATLLALFALVQTVATLVVSAVANRGGNRRPWFIFVIAVTVLGLALAGLTPLAAPWATAALLGVGIGGLFPLALTLPIDLAPDPHTVSALSGMAFGLGYALGAVGPFGIGLVRDLTGSYVLPIGVVAVLGLVQMAIVPRLKPVV